MTACIQCQKPAVVHVSWIANGQRNNANLCAIHAQFVQDRVLAKELADPSYSGGLVFSPIDTSIAA